MKKLISLVLSLVLCVSMIPAAIATEGSVPATGVYFALENGLPAGDSIQGEENQDHVPIYEGLAYSPDEAFTFYYYDNDGTDAASLTLSNNKGNSDAKESGGFADVAITPLGTDGKLWQVSFTPTESAEFNLDFTFNSGNNGHNVLFCFRPNTPDVPDLPAYATGFYLDTENNAPKGNPITGSRPDANGPWGYWDISYDSSEENVLFYYDAKAASLSVNSKPDGFSVSVESVADHFWKITFRAPEAGCGDFTVDVSAGDAGFPVSFVDSYVPTYAPGLYYKPLRDVNNNNPHVDANDPYSNAPLVMSPYFERFDRAFYFYDGNDFTPVDVVFDSDLTVDPVCFDGHPGWYIFAAYDFCSGKIFYDDASTQPPYYLDVSTRLPDFAFYAGDTVSKENFRMYTIAEENADGEFAGYKFKKTLTFLPADSNFSFGLGPDSDVELDIYCFQRQYLPNGNEVNEIPYTDFKYVCEASSNANGDFITFTLYTNDSDVLCHLNGVRGNDWLFGAYVNVLAPDDDTSLLFHANDQGNFASAKFLPKHIFKELAALDSGVTLSHEEFPGNITMDENVVSNIAAQTAPVSFYMTADAATEDEEAIIAEALADNETLLDVLDLKLYFGPDSVHELGGNAVIQYQADLPNGTQVKVYYLNNGQLEAMNATYEDGVIIFSTPHFSEFVIASAPEPVVPPRPNRPSRPSAGGGSSTTTPSQPTISTETKPDGSTTTTESKPDGTVTESNTSKPTTDASGNTSQTTTETSTGKDGVTESKTETVTKPDGSASSTTESTTTKPDGTTTESKTETSINADGSTASTTTETTTNKDGTVTESKTESTTSTVTNKDGSTTETKQETTTTSTGSKTESTTVTTVNKDGSSTATTTATTTDKAGTVTASKTESTTNKNGTTTEKTTTTETKANGTVTESKTETTINKDGSSKATTTETVTKADGTKVESKSTATTSLSTNKATGTVIETRKETTTTSDGVKSEGTTVTQIQKDGTVTSKETVNASDSTGTTATKTTTLDAKGEVTTTAEVSVSSKAVTEAAKTGAAVTIPVEVPTAKTTEAAPTVQVNVPKTAESVKVELPVQNVTPGTVAVIVNADGTEKIVSASVVTENGVALTLDGSATVKLVDNAKSFVDVPETNVFYNEISSLSARNIMIGVSNEKFDLNNSVTLDQVANVAGRITGAVDVSDFNAGVAWGKDGGLKTGSTAATRGEVLKALYIAAGSPAVEDTSILARFKDASSIPADLATIAAWAAQNGILKGNMDGTAGLSANVTRGQACALAGRTMGTLA